MVVNDDAHVRDVRGTRAGPVTHQSQHRLLRRDLKGILCLRPVYHSKAERIRSHVLIRFLAPVIIRVAETAQARPGG